MQAGWVRVHGVGIRARSFRPARPNPTPMMVGWPDVAPNPSDPQGSRRGPPGGHRGCGGRGDRCLDTP